jgi:CheY-like chemotaxis protein
VPSLPCVLLAEDSPVNALVIAKQLDTLGFACTVTENGEQAWAALQAGTSFVALLTDCDMPVLDGYSLAPRVRGDVAFAGLPIIALSARPDDAQLARCRAAGMDDCLPKPVSNAALASALSARAVVAGDGDDAVDDLDALKRVFPDPRALSGLFAQFVQCARAPISTHWSVRTPRAPSSPSPSCCIDSPAACRCSTSANSRTNSNGGDAPAACPRRPNTRSCVANWSR